MEEIQECVYSYTMDLPVSRRFWDANHDVC